MRAFFDGAYRLTASHADHRNRRPPSLGGEDWALPEGTLLRAPFSGRWRFRSAGSGGWTFTGTPDDPALSGLVVEAMHVSRAMPSFTLGGPALHVREGEPLGWSGGRRGHPGAGNSTGPHLHAHGILNGRRIAFTTARAWANEREGTTMSTPAEIAAAVWNTPVRRGTTQVRALQELADAKTIALRLEAKLDQLLKAGGLTEADLQAIADQVAEQVAAEVADELAQRLSE